MTRITSCPYCKKPVEYSTSNPFRPFCSKRCKDIDLGDWADERFRVPSSEPVSDDFLIPDEPTDDSSGSSSPSSGSLLH